MPEHFDLIVIGSGPGGASLVHRLGATGKKILLLERGDYLKREPKNWDANPPGKHCISNCCPILNRAAAP